MTGGLLDFFVLEATEYVDQLDALASRATIAPPESVPFARAARGLRGAATMAKLGGIAEVATGLERLIRQLRDGNLRWNAALRGTAIAAIDDLKFLVRGARTWGESEDKRVTTRMRELDQVAPKQVTPVQRGKGAAYLAGAAADAAAGLLAYAEAPSSPEEFAETMRRVRALRGVAALKDLPPLAEVVDAVDVAAKPIELGHENATAERRRLLRAAARVLLEGGEAVRQGGLPPTDSVAVREFAHAADTLRSGERDVEDVVPINSLFPDGDPASHITASPNPPTTATQRFRLEVVSQAEHLRRLVADGRAAVDAATRDRVGRELRTAVRALARAAHSFQAKEIADLFIASERGAAALDQRALWVLDEAGTELSRQESGPESVAPRFLALAQRLAGTPPAPIQAAPARHRRSGANSDGSRTVTPTGHPSSSRVAGANIGTSGTQLRDLLASGIAGLSPLETTHLAAPARGEDDDVIPIEELLFRGREALDQALHLGERLRNASSVPDAATLSELYDLLQLAAAD
jgi:chemotaxis protein histidine kinase CheA